MTDTTATEATGTEPADPGYTDIDPKVVVDEFRKSRLAQEERDLVLLGVNARQMQLLAGWDPIAYTAAAKSLGDQVVDRQARRDGLAKLVSDPLDTTDDQRSTLKGHLTGLERQKVAFTELIENADIYFADDERATQVAAQERGLQEVDAALDATHEALDALPVAKAPAAAKKTRARRA